MSDTGSHRPAHSEPLPGSVLIPDDQLDDAHSARSPLNIPAAPVQKMMVRVAAPFSRSLIIGVIRHIIKGEPELQGLDDPIARDRSTFLGIKDAT